MTLVSEFIVFILSYHHLKTGDKRIESGTLWLWESNSSLAVLQSLETVSTLTFVSRSRKLPKLFGKSICGRVSLIFPEELLSRKRACQCL